MPFRLTQLEEICIWLHFKHTGQHTQLSYTLVLVRQKKSLKWRPAYNVIKLKWIFRAIANAMLVARSQQIYGQRLNGCPLNALVYHLHHSNCLHLWFFNWLFVIRRERNNVCTKKKNTVRWCDTTTPPKVNGSFISMYFSVKQVLPTGAAMKCQCNGWQMVRLVEWWMSVDGR